MKIGVLVPHFGPTASLARTIEFSVRLESMGFNGVFVRDQIGFQGHGWEPRSDFFLDPLVTLTAIGARTTKLLLGSATLIPFRHPCVLAQLIGSLSFVAKGRFLMGWGAGAFEHSFEITGLRFEDRIDLAKETIQVIRALSSPRASFDGRFVRFSDVTIAPSPPSDLPVWYGGSSNNSVDRALDYCDGWLPGRCPLRVFDRKVERLRRGEARVGKRMAVGVTPVISIENDRETALRKVNVDGLLAEARGRTPWAFAGPFHTATDLKGALIAGTPDDVIAGLSAFKERGVDQVVLDLRMRLDVYEESVQRIAEEVLPAFGDAGPGPMH